MSIETKPSQDEEIANVLPLKSILLISILIIAVISFAGNSYVPEYSILNQGNLGVSKYYEALSETHLFYLNRFIISPMLFRDIGQANSSEEMIIIVGSERQYTPSELAVYQKFVESGGSILLFEDFGPARSVANTFGISFIDGVLRETDENFYTNSPDKPLILETVISSQLDLSLNPIQLNRANLVWDPDGFVNLEAFPILFSSSPTAYYDTNDNNLIEQSDIFDQIPLGVFKPIKDGNIIVLGDASIPVNQHWGQVVSSNQGEYITGNAFFTLAVTMYMASLTNVSRIYFDESHKAISIMSAAGIINWLFGSYLGIITGILTLFVIISVVVVVFYIKRTKAKKRLKGKNDSPLFVDKSFVSTPTRVEKGISEQYILYQVMNKRYIHVSVSNLYNNLRQTGKADDFLDNLVEKYGSFDEIDNMETIKLIHSLLQDFIANQKRRWL